MSDCKFCDPKILNEQVFLENKGASALVCIAPNCPGHSLVISKKHAQHMLDLEEEDVRDVAELVFQVKKILAVVFQTRCFTDVLQDDTRIRRFPPPFSCLSRTQNDFWGAILWDDITGPC